MKNLEVKQDQVIEASNERIFLERMEKIVRYQNLLIGEIQNDIQLINGNDAGEQYFGLIPSYVNESIFQIMFENLLDQSENNLIILRDLQSYYLDLAQNGKILKTELVSD